MPGDTFDPTSGGVQPTIDGLGQQGKDKEALTKAQIEFDKTVKKADAESTASTYSRTKSKEALDLTLR